MADKNLHDIKIDDLESNKKTPLKNILTLLALLFIILVISVVITKLILNTDGNTDIDSNITTTEIDANNTSGSALAAVAGVTGTVIAGTQNAASNGADAVKNTVSNAKDGLKDRASSANDAVKDASSATKDGTKNLADVATLKERNISGSKTKVTLRDHRPLSSVKELVTPKSPAKKDSSSSKKSTSSNSATASKKATSTPKKSTTKSDKVVAKKSTSSGKATSDKSIVGYTLTHGYYIKIGTFKNTAAAIKQIKKTGLNYKLIKVKNDKTLTRVFIGTFSSKANAQSNLSKAKKISKGAYIIKK